MLIDRHAPDPSTPDHQSYREVVSLLGLTG
jgi:hypothetical protein